MATLSTSALTLLEWAKRLDPNGKVADIAELLTQTNEILLDMTFIEGNLPTGHRTTIRTGLPAVYWRLLNQGIAPSKSTTAQIDEQAGMLEAWSEVDVDLAELGGNVGAVRLSEARGFLEAMNQEMAATLFYGNGSLAAEEFNGLAVRYSSLTAAASGANVVDGGSSGSSTNASMWVVAWSPETVFGLFPQGSKAGIFHEDLGRVTVEVTAGVAGNRMRAYQDHFQWKAGLCVKDWRYVVRIANIDIADLDAAPTTAVLIPKLEDAVERLPNALGSPVIYCNRSIRKRLRREARISVGAGGGITYDNVMGKRIMNFGDIPIRLCDALLNTEATVS